MTTPMEAELELLQKEFTSMGNMVYQALNAASNAVLNSNADHIAELIKNDKTIDGRENTIDIHCIKLWATQFPVATDLRLIFAVIRSANELERMGDHAKQIGRCVQNAIAHGPLHLLANIKEACEETPELLDNALKAHQQQHSADAKNIRDTCKLRKSNLKGLNETFAALIEGGQHNTAILLEVIDIAQHFQRIYALIGNICKNTIYMVEGEIVKHKGREHPLTDH